MMRKANHGCHPDFFRFIYILANLNPNDNTAILQQITKLDAIYWLLTTTLLDINTVTCISWMPCIIFGIV